jgi:hypothetical protein
MEKEEFFTAHFISLSADDPAPVSDVALDFNTFEFIPFGADNLFPQALALFSRLSPNHRGILNSKLIYIMGDGIASDDEPTNELIKIVNYEGESLTDVTSKGMRDDITFGNVFMEFITDRNGSFLWCNHIDATKCRLAKDKENVILHPDWRRYNGKSDKFRRVLPLYPKWVKDTDENGFSAFRTVVHMKDYEPEFVYYGLPDYIAAKDSINIDYKTNKWNLARLKNSFRISGILVVPVKDPKESKEVLDNIKKNYIGEDNQAKLLTITKSRSTENEKADQTQLIETKQDDGGSWMDLHSQSISDMVTTHRWFRSLCSLADNTGFDTQRILNEYEVALNTTIASFQKSWLELYMKMYKEVTRQDVELKFINRPPFDTDNYKYIWELRREKGLDYDENDPAQNIIVTNG